MKKLNKKTLNDIIDKTNHDLFYFLKELIVNYGVKSQSLLDNPLFQYFECSPAVIYELHTFKMLFSSNGFDDLFDIIMNHPWLMENLINNMTFKLNTDKQIIVVFNTGLNTVDDELNVLFSSIFDHSQYVLCAFIEYINNTYSKVGINNDLRYHLNFFTAMLISHCQRLPVMDKSFCNERSCINIFYVYQHFIRDERIRLNKCINGNMLTDDALSTLMSCLGYKIPKKEILEKIQLLNSLEMPRSEIFNYLDNNDTITIKDIGMNLEWNNQ